MKLQFLRRRGLGKGSTEGMVEFLRKWGVDASVVRNDLAKTDAPVIVRWGCTGYTGGAKIIINESEAIHTVNSKATFREKLQNSGVSVPKSFFSKESAATAIARGLRLIGRKSRHAQGKGAEVIATMVELKMSQSDYWSVIIPKTQEFRVYPFFGRVIQVAEKVMPEDRKHMLLWNKAQGNSAFYNVRWDKWNLDVVLEALKVHAISGCDFEGVDVMLHEGVPYILESNSAPSMTTEYRKQSFAKGFKWMMDEIERTGEKPQHLELSEHGRGYKDYIHPAVRNGYEK